jgi:non-specific serine/threonine protein kinase
LSLYGDVQPEGPEDESQATEGDNGSSPGGLSEEAAADPGPDVRAPLEITLTPTNNLVFSDGSPDWRPRLFDLAANREDGSVPLSPSARFWKGFVESFIVALCRLPDDLKPLNLPPPSEAERQRLVSGAPPMPGGEYLSADSLHAVWVGLIVWSTEETQNISVPEFLAQRAPRWRRVGRVTFHLGENRGNPAKPFGFLATYVTSLTQEGRDRHLPLARALSQYSGANDKPTLVNLLSPVKAAAEKLDWVRDMDASGSLYHPLAWTVPQAYRFLKDTPELEDAGLTVRVPDWWRKKPEVRVKILLGQNKTPVFGLSSLLDWDVQLAVGDESLTAEEVEQLLAQAETEELVFFKGRWVEANRKQLTQALEYWNEAQGAAASGISFLQAMRLLAGMPEAAGEKALEGFPPPSEWVKPEAGEALKELLALLRSPEAAGTPPDLTAELRPYQQVGLSWLTLITGLGLGACLADDMGLGKTIQVLALLLNDKRARAEARASALPFRTGGQGKPPKGTSPAEGDRAAGAPREASEAQAAPGSSPPDPHPSLLICPASLIANWKSEVERFAPSLRLHIFHPSETSRDVMSAWESDPQSILRDCDLVVTSYALSARRLELFEGLDFRMVILDEAQAIKNPGTAQSRAVRRIRAQARLALTGTPIENRLMDLWSLFDFLNPGLLGSSAKFASVVAELEKRKEDQYGPLRRLVAPYLLRRLKSDRRIIADLPDKVETFLYCNLTADQAKLYSKVVENLQRSLREFTGSGAERMKRRGLVLQTLMRLKQLVNHPAHMTGDGDWDPARSGKFLRLAELAKAMAERQDRLLVFTQFQEIIEPLLEHLTAVFGRPGLCLHGGTPVKARRGLVDEFQRPDGPPFFILSLKAGGTGLNLTAAGQVVHFDRWWNPAVEDQATDRAYRIGQRKNVLVHKCVTQGTLEERIDAMLRDKRAVAGEILAGGDEINFADMDDEALLGLVSLDIDRAVLS